jgi:LemA protein
VVDAEARIARMQAEGLITAAQADGLRQGVAAQAGRGSAAAERPRRSARLVAAMLAAGIVVVALAVLLLGGNEIVEVQNVAETLNQPEAVGTMNRSLAAILTAAVLLAVPIVVFLWSYNGLVSKEEAVLAAWAQTESNFQRRADLVPALVETVSRFMKHERETLTAVTDERSRSLDELAKAVDSVVARQARAAETEKQGASLEDQTRFSALYEAEAAVGKEVAGILAVAEAYPQLRSADQFLELQAQLEGTENRINVTRMRFNEAVGIYNGAIRRLPGNLVASIGGFRRKAYFQAAEGAERAPGVEFD